MEETVGRVTPCTTLRSVLRLKAVFEGGGSLEFFQVPELRRKLGIFSSPRNMKRYEENMKRGGIMKIYEEKMKKYEENRKEIRKGNMKNYEGISRL